MRDNFVHFSILVSKLNKQLQKLKTDGMQQFGLKAVHTLCLYQLWDRPEGMSFSEVQEACDLDQALVSRILSKLTDIGMVKKEGAPGRYNARYCLTSEGQQVTGQIRSIVGEVHARVDEGIEPEELDVFYKVLRQLLRNFDNMDPELLEHPTQE